LADVIKLRILRWGDYAGSAGGPKVITKVLKWNEGGRRFREGQVMTETESEW